MKSFRESRGQEEKEYVPPNKRMVSKKPKPHYKPRTHKNVSSDRYQSFLKKYWDLENTIDFFATQDLMYFFREKAREAGIKYVIANMKRDMGIFKRLRQSYESSEICLMIEFLFFSDQDYLDKETIQPTVLVSAWCNTIYQDSMLWLEDKYMPGTHRKKVTREWDEPVSDTKTKIGEW